MISNTINQKIAGAMKAKDEIRLSTLRLLSSAFNYERIAKQHELSDDEEIVVIRREAKKRNDAIEGLKQAQGKKSTATAETLIERIGKEEKELAVLKEFLPQDMSEEEINKFIDEAIAETGANSVQEMGKVIGAVMQKTKGRADGGKVSGLVREKLT